MQRLEVIEKKMSTIEHIENLDKKVHNQLAKFGSSVGTTLKLLKSKEHIFICLFGGNQVNDDHIELGIET